MPPTLPSSLGRYEVLEELGKGAMGVVYLARDPLIGRLVALKTFRASQAMHGSELLEYRARFMREAQSAGILSHRNIVTIHDVVDSTDSGVTFIAMEYVRGVNLKELMMRGNALPLEQVVDIVSQVAEALDYAHSKGVIHRDIKPANLIIETQGLVKITDFGIARLETSDLTHEGQLLGTPNYMAPERILGQRVDHRTDIFSLGVVLYEMLTRQKPFQGENLTMVSHRIVYEPFAAPRQYVPDLPQAVVHVLEKSLEKDPEKRFDTAGGLAIALREALQVALANETTVRDRPLLAPPPAAVLPPPVPLSASEDHSATQDVQPMLAAAAPRSTASGRGLRAGRIVAITGLAVVLGLALAAGGFGWLRATSPPVGKPDPADRQRARVLPYLQMAHRQLAAGNTQEAAAWLARAQAAAPQEPHVLKLQERARASLAQSQTVAAQAAQLEQLFAGANAALAANDPARAIDLARQVLALAPGDARANEVLAKAQQLEERNRRQQELAAQRAAAARSAPAPTAAPVAAASAPAPAAEVGDATVRIDFFTEIPEGVVTVYAGPRQILGEPFKFYKRSGLFHNEPKSGRVEASRTVAAGPTTFRIYVARPKEKPAMLTVEANLRGGQTRVLKINVDRSGLLTAAIE